MGLGEALMQGCSDVCITREFAIFSMSHLMQVFGEPFEVARDLYIRDLKGEECFCANG